MKSLSILLLSCVVLLTACGSDGGGGVAVNPKNVDLVSFEKDGNTITEVTINEDTPLTGVRLVITGSKSDAEFYEFATESSNTTLVPNENIVITGTDKFRDLNVTPALNQFGTTTISGVMTNTKTGLSKSTSIDLIVLPVNDLPGITADASLSLTNGLTVDSDTVVFSITDVDSSYVAGNITTTGFDAAQLTVGSVSATATEGEFSFLVTSKDFVAGDTTITITVTDPDAEGDQHPVTQDITVSVSNTDSDSDSISDYQDNCTAVANADQANSDNDVNGNACDTDDDNDGVLDVNDAYPVIPLNGLTDTDGDGCPNECDISCIAMGMVADLDDDNDGALDIYDAYPLISLGGLTDTDGDGRPNNCDAACVGLGMVADIDDDNDGVLDVNDAYPLISLGGRVDTDGDGIPDVCDAACLALGMLADDMSAPVLAVVTAVTTPTNDSTPNFTFSSDEAGIITYAGDCTSSSSTAVSGNNTISFNTLSVAIHSNCSIKVTDASENASVDLAIPSFTVVKFKQLNDTGITLCGDYAYVPGSLSHNNDVDCAAAGATQTVSGTLGDDPIPAGQDAVYGRDSNEATNSDSDGIKGFSFTKLDNSGVALSIQGGVWSDVGNEAAGTKWSCVQDNVTGLIWEIKTNDNGLRDKDWTYTWYNTDSAKNGGNAGKQDTGVSVGSDNCFNNARCDTEKYVTDINSANICGETNNDWRLPSAEELLSITSKKQINPSIDNIFIPNTNAGSFWSASTYAGLSTNAWNIGFLGGDSGSATKTYDFNVRLVRDVY